LKALNQLEYLGEKDWDEKPSKVDDEEGWSGRVTRLGPGNTWTHVYKYLEPMGLSVVGGRVGSVGVGGFLVGGKF
jgi:hypothetical protein